MPQLPLDQCPEPEAHGNPFRYCPHCEWTEPVRTEMRTPIQLAAREINECQVALAVCAQEREALWVRALRAESMLDAIEAMLTKKKRMGTLFDVQQIRAAPLPDRSQE